LPVRGVEHDEVTSVHVHAAEDKVYAAGVLVDVLFLGNGELCVPKNEQDNRKRKKGEVGEENK
jgi:hypothetical protein